MNNFLGNLNKVVGTLLDYLFEGLIGVVSFFVHLFKSLQQVFLTIILFGGCLFIVLLFLTTSTLENRWPFIFLLLILFFPLLGNIAVSYLKYLQYMVTEYFYEKADYYLLGKDVSYEKMGDYGKRYQRIIEEEERRAQEEAYRRAEEERRRRQEEFARQFEEMFRNAQQGGYQQYGPGYGPYQGQSQGGYYHPNPAEDFIQKYEHATDVLGVDHLADKYEIKLAYRKMAKRYHPDLNPGTDATAKFQEINAAYEFLTDENIERYKRSKGN